MSKAKDLQQLIKTLVGSNPSPAQKKSYYFSFAFKLYEAGDKADAKNYLEEYLAIKTQDVKGYNLLGQIYEELNSPNDAIKAYNRSLSIDDSQIRLMLKLSSLYLQVKNITEANFWLDRAETKANNDEKAEIVQNRIEILKLSNGSRVFEQAAAGLVHYPKHLGINIQYLEALEARESYFS
jgi:tetratricopeptide (TPR) repeat protein